MVETTAAMAATISSVVGVFPTEASLEDAAHRLTLSGFNRAALSRPPAHLPPEEAAAPLDAQPVMTATDRQQARTLGTSMSGAVAGLAAAGVTIATGGAAAVAAVAAVGVGGMAAAATALVQHGAEVTAHESNTAAAALGQLTLSVGVLTPQEIAQAEAAMREAGATQVLTPAMTPIPGAAA